MHSIWLKATLENAQHLFKYVSLRKGVIVSRMDAV